MITIKKDRGAFHFQAKDITGLQYYPSQKIAIITDTEGELLRVTLEDVDAFNKLVADVKAEGNDLIALPVFSQGEEYPQYIAPHAVTFVTSSKADKNGKIAAIVGVLGMGRIDTGSTTKETIDAIVEKASKSKKLLAFTADEASARFYTPDMLYIAPEAILKISAHEECVDIHLSWAGQLDVVMSGYRFGETKASEASKSSAAFADMLASYNPTLTKVQGLEKRSAYVRVKEYSYCATWERGAGDADKRYGYSLQYRDRGADGFQASFNSAAARDASLAPLLNAMGFGKKSAKSGPSIRGH